MSIQEQIDREFIQALLEAWCDAHNLHQSQVTYEDGKIIIPVKL